MIDGGIYSINFDGNKGFEINNIHLGIIFTIPNIKNLVFCLPLTSPKEKHFKNITAFNNRNHLQLSHFNYIYLKRTDSIALLDQMKSISTLRIINPYKINNMPVTLNDNERKLIETKMMKYFRNILKR